MIIESITLKNFRNHSYLSYDFSKNINVLTGPNGAGKTSVIEAIGYLSTARSFRSRDDNELIQLGKSNAEIKAVIKEGDLKRKIRVVINKKGKQVFLNDKPISRLSELTKIVNVVLFEPQDVNLFRGSPRQRRAFLDVAISKKHPIYLDYLSNYEKALKERNEILKQEEINKILLETTTEMLVNFAEKIVAFRREYVKDINDILIKIIRALTSAREEIEVRYTPFIDDEKDFKKAALAAYSKTCEQDLEKQSTTIGIHREDFTVLLNGNDISEKGSQGENRIVALALKLAPYFLIKEKEKKPIVVLDDVMSELDQSHRLKLVEFLRKFEQVFITATRLEISGASQFIIKAKKSKEVS